MFQDKLGRPLTHIICVLHCIERLMRKAVEEIGNKIANIFPSTLLLILLIVLALPLKIRHREVFVVFQKSSIINLKMDYTLKKSVKSQYHFHLVRKIKCF